jgi:SAM-dependent methyltransferase
LLRYSNMPAAAQFFPNAAALATERGTTLSVVQCSGCGLVQLDCAPVPYYREVIRAAGFSDEMREFRTKQFAELTSRYSLQGKKVIEIGCGRGEYLELLAAQPVEAHGLEFAEDAVQHCRNKGLRVNRGYIDSPVASIEDGPFAAFFILSFLEHFPHPSSALRGIAHNLSSDGIGILEVPNFDLILRNEMFAEFIADHVSYFTRDTLALALSLNGFDVIECKEVWHDYIISAVVKKRRPTSLAHFHDHQSRLTRDLHEYIATFGDMNVAVWGAGHQALALIALAGLAGKVKYVVDSAPFKQGKFTPATHIPIVSPDHIERDRVDAIIVMAASYSDEVTRTIRRRFGPKLDVAVLREHSLERIDTKAPPPQ